MPINIAAIDQSASTLYFKLYTSIHYHTTLEWNKKGMNSLNSYNIKQYESDEFVFENKYLNVFEFRKTRLELKRTYLTTLVSNHSINYTALYDRSLLQSYSAQPTLLACQCSSQELILKYARATRELNSGPFAPAHECVTTRPLRSLWIILADAQMRLESSTETARPIGRRWNRTTENSSGTSGRRAASSSSGGTWPRWMTSVLDSTQPRREHSATARKLAPDRIMCCAVNVLN